MIVAQQASDWLEVAENRWKAEYGDIPNMSPVDFPTERGEQVPYPLGHKRCARCGKESERKLPLDGTNYYCSGDVECQLERQRFYDRKRAAVAS